MSDEDLSTRDLPIVLVGDGHRRDVQLRIKLEAAGWRVRTAEDGAAACALATREPVALTLLNFAEHDSLITQIAPALRSVSGPSATSPIVGYNAPPSCENDPLPSDLDALMPAPANFQVLVDTLEFWRPLSLASTRRIATMFGAGPIAGMIERLARRLEGTLTTLDQGAFDKPESRTEIKPEIRAEAHRLAGLCGTLGFGQAHAAWLDLSHGDEAALPEVRRTTRLTLSAIARGL